MHNKRWVVLLNNLIESRVLGLVPLICVRQPMPLGFPCHRHGCILSTIFINLTLFYSVTHINDRFQKYNSWNRDWLLWVDNRLLVSANIRVSLQPAVVFGSCTKSSVRLHMSSLKHCRLSWYLEISRPSLGYYTPHAFIRVHLPT